MNRIEFIKYSDAEFEYVKAIRTSVFINEQGAIASEEFDCYDPSSLFALLLEDDIPIGTARIAEIDNKFKIGRIAILKEHRGKGYGALLVNSVEKKCIEMGADIIYVDARNHAVSFYEKLGFKIIGDEIIDRGLKHIQMAKEV